MNSIKKSWKEYKLRDLKQQLQYHEGSVRSIKAEIEELERELEL